MKRFFYISLLLALGIAGQSKAVVISWASEALASGTTSASLIYVSEGAPTYADGVLQNGTVIGTASGYAIDGTTLYAQSSADVTRDVGSYYVVLFNDSSQYAVSTTALPYDDTTAITRDLMYPAPRTFSPDAFSGWAPVPEPGSAMLLLAGGALAALRRRKTA